jgi:hypothetical protein
MSDHKPHLHAEPLSPKVITIIEQLQSWLGDTKFEEVVQGYAKSPRRHGVYVSDDIFEKLGPLLDEIKLKVQVGKLNRI